MNLQESYTTGGSCTENWELHMDFMKAQRLTFVKQLHIRSHYNASDNNGRYARDVYARMKCS
jgi:hypothetical protein